MATITREQMQKLFDLGAQQGLSRDEIVRDALSKGHQLEGLDVQKVNEELQQPTGFAGFLKGVGQSIIGTAAGALSLGQKTGSKLFGTPAFDEQGEQIGRLQEFAQPKNRAQRAGKITGEIAQFAIPGTGGARVVRGASRFPRIAKFFGRSAASGGIASAQEGEVGSGTVGAIAGEAIFPVGGLVVGAIKKTGQIAGNITKRLAGGVGVSFDDIAKNPQAAQRTAEAILGGAETVKTVLRQESERIVRGISSYRARLRSEFGNTLVKLDKIDIEPESIRKSLTGVWRNQKVKFTEGTANRPGGFSLDDVDFADKPLAVKRAQEIIERVNSMKSTTGKSVRDVMDFIDSRKFSPSQASKEGAAGSFNEFAQATEDALRSTVAKASPILEDANRKFSEGMDVIGVMEQEFGKVRFVNLPEFNTAAKRTEGLLKKGGISEEVLEDFFAGIGDDVTDLRATEAVRGAFDTQPVAEGAGLTPFEIVRQVTAGAVSPEDATRIAIKVAQAGDATQKAVGPFAKALSTLAPAARGAVLEFMKELLDDNPSITPNAAPLPAPEPQSDLAPAQSRSEIQPDMAERVADITGTTSREAAEFLSQFTPEQQEQFLRFLQSNA